MLSMLILAAQTTAVLEPPVVSSPPAIVSMAPADNGRAPSMMLARPRQPVSIEVEARGENGLIWSGTLLVGDLPSSYRETKNEPAPPVCPQTRNYPGHPAGFSITLSRNTYAREGEQLRVMVEWSRNDTAACPQATLIRKAAIEATAAFEPGTAITLRGDAGLIVRLRPR